jgi:hypothetical protein
MEILGIDLLKRLIFLKQYKNFDPLLTQTNPDGSVSTWQKFKEPELGSSCCQSQF